MAVVVVSDSNNQLNDAESNTNWTNQPTGGGGPGTEPDFFYQNTLSISRKMGTTAGGFKYTHGSTTDMTVAADSVCILKGFWANKDVLTAVPAAQFQIGSGATDTYEYDIADDGTRGDIDYPTKGGWILALINPNVTAWRDLTNGTPVLTAVDVFVIQSDFSGTSKSENVAMDAIDLSPGLFLVGGDSTDPDGVFQDFVDYDEGTVANRIGHVSTIGDTLFILGILTIGENAAGTDTVTVFQDTGTSLVFPFNRGDVGDVGIEIELAGGAGTDIDFIRNVMKGEGQSRLKLFFDTDNEVSAAADTITFTDGHDFLTGQAVIYSNEGGSETPGPTSGNEYFINRVSATAVSLHVARVDSFSDTTRVALTESTAGNGESHTLTRGPDTRPVLEVRGTTGSFQIQASILDSFGIIVLTSGATILSSTLNNCRQITLGGGTLTSMIVNSPTLARGEPFIVTDELDNITNCTFNGAFLGTSGRGHAIEVTSTTNSPFNLVGNTFNDYGPDRTPFNALNDVDDANDEVDIIGHGYVTGKELFYGDEGGTPITGLTDGLCYYIRAVTVDAISFHSTKFDADNNLNKIAIAVGSDEDHYLYSAHAAVFNNSGGAITISVSNGLSPSIRNSVGSTTTVTNDIQLTFSNMRDNTEVRVYAAGTSTELDGIENATAGSADARTFAVSLGAATSVDYVIHNETYETIRVESFSWPATTTVLPINQRFDRNFSNP